METVEGDGHDHGRHHDHAQGLGSSHDLGHSHGHGHSHGPVRAGRAGLIGMGIAGGMVPSPSALVVLLGSIALGRTVFGVVLVVGYGLGMAATLTAAGLLLVHVRGRLDRLVARRRRHGSGTALAGLVPVATAALVLVVGLGLAVRSLSVGA